MSGSKWEDRCGRTEGVEGGETVMRIYYMENNQKLQRKLSMYWIAECRTMQIDPYSSP